MTNTIEINGKSYPIKFPYSALMELEKNMGKTFGELGVQMSMGSITALINVAYVGLKHGARLANKDFKFDVEQLGDIMDKPSLEQVSKIFEDSFADKTDESTDDEGSKKK